MDYLQSIINEQYQKLNFLKEKALLERLEKLGINIDWDLESKRRFKTIIREQQGNIERYFFNDGTKEGRLIIAFQVGEVATRPESGMYLYELEVTY